MLARGRAHMLPPQASSPYFHAFIIHYLWCMVNACSHDGQYQSDQHMQHDQACSPGSHATTLHVWCKLHKAWSCWPNTEFFLLKSKESLLYTTCYNCVVYQPVSSPLPVQAVQETLLHSLCDHSLCRAKSLARRQAGQSSYSPSPPQWHPC